MRAARKRISLHVNNQALFMTSFSFEPPRKFEIMVRAVSYAIAIRSLIKPVTRLGAIGHVTYNTFK